MTPKANREDSASDFTGGGEGAHSDFSITAGLVGRSPPMRKLYETIKRVSRYKTNVLVLGESGTGKELVARALHGRGPRRRHVFVPLNCAALSRDILENELFGHERGAFTGANERKKGLFELADRGTLFLDEIGEMDVSTQAKLLRVLERHAFRRLGGTSKINVDVGIVAASNRDLDASIAEGRFREDLYYRLKVVTIQVPPLRARKEDLPALVESFIGDFNRRNDGKIHGLSPNALSQLMDHEWPGNVRELKNVVENAAVLAVTDTISSDAIAEILGDTRRRGAPTARGPSSDLDESTIRIPFGTTLAEVEKRMIAAYLERYETREATARALGIGVRTLYTKLGAIERSPRSRAPKRQA